MNKTIYINVEAEAALKKIKVRKPRYSVSAAVSEKIISDAKKFKIK